MFFQNVNLVAVLVAGILGVIIGAVWFSPYLFGKMWIKGMGLTHEHAKNITLSYLITFVLTFVTAYVLAVIFNSIVVASIGALLLVPILLWLGFAVPIAMNDYLWGNRHLSLICVSLGYTLISLVTMSLIVGLFS